MVWLIGGGVLALILAGDRALSSRAKRRLEAGTHVPSHGKNSGANPGADLGTSAAHNRSFQNYMGPGGV